MTRNENLTKIRFDQESKVELLWAHDEGGSRYAIRSLPFFTYGISWGDIVTAIAGRDGVLTFQSLSTRSGHSCYRVFTVTEIDDLDSIPIWKQISALGCTYERATNRLFAIDVPPKSDIHDVYRALKTGEELKVWEFEEANCEHVVRH